MDVYAGILDGIREKKSSSISLESHLQSLKPQVRYLRKAYFAKPVVVPYDKREIQESYLVTYFPHYYQLIYKIFLEEAPDFFKGRKNITVSFIGGGPGSEIYGLAKYIANNAPDVRQFNINLFDINAATWKYSHDIIDVHLLKKILPADVKVDWSSCTLNITSPNEVASYQQRFANSDLVVVQNCLNEIAPRLISQTNENIVGIFDWLRPHSLLLLSDMTSGARDVLKDIEKQIIEKGTIGFHKTTLKSLHSGSLISVHHLPPFLITRNLLTGEDGLIPRKYVKFDYTVLSKKWGEKDTEQNSIGFNALYKPLNFSHLDVNGHKDNKVFIGIDFGTSTTAVSAAYVNNGRLEIEPLVIPQKDKNGSVKLERLIPVVVSKVNNSLMVGYYAALYKRTLSYGVDCWHSFKANLGCLETVNYPFSILKDHDSLKIASMKDAFSIFLKYLYREVSQAVSKRFPGKEPMYALSVPVDFGSCEKRQLKAMMSDAGFQCADVPFIEEPNAALVHYFFASNTAICSEKPLKVLIFDIGAGTVDLSIIELQREGADITSRLLAVHRRGHQGGIWIDHRIAMEVIQSNPLLSALPQEKHQSLIAYCEHLKEMMCKRLFTDRSVGFILHAISESDAIVSLPDPLEIGAGNKVLVGITYQTLSKIMKEYWLGVDGFKGISISLNECLSNAALQEESIDKVLITGGGGRNPYIKNYLAKHFGAAKLFFVDDIQEQVARGTALHSFVVNSFGKTIITSLLNENYYIELDGKKKKIFSKGESYPTHDVDFYFSNVKLNSSKISVYKSENFVVNKTFIVPDPAKVQQLVFFIDPDQEVRCEIVMTTESFPAQELLN